MIRKWLLWWFLQKFFYYYFRSPIGWFWSSLASSHAMVYLFEPHSVDGFLNLSYLSRRKCCSWQFCYGFVFSNFRMRLFSLHQRLVLRCFQTMVACLASTFQINVHLDIHVCLMLFFSNLGVWFDLFCRFWPFGFDFRGVRFHDVPSFFFVSSLFSFLEG